MRKRQTKEFLEKNYPRGTAMELFLKLNLAVAKYSNIESYQDITQLIS